MGLVPSTLRRAPVTLALVAATTAVFLWQRSSGGSADLAAQVRLGALQPLRVAEHGESFRLLANAFVHHGWLHLLASLGLLLHLGSRLEGAWGGARLLVVWVWGAVASSLVEARMSGFPALAAVGSSGATLAVAGFLLGAAWFGASPGFDPEWEPEEPEPEEDRPHLGRAVTLTFLLGLGGWFGYPVHDNWAHLAGLLFGVLASLTVAGPRSEERWQRPLAVASAMVVAAAGAWTWMSGPEALPTLHQDAARSLAVRVSEERDGWVDPDLVARMLDHHRQADTLDEGLEMVTRTLGRTTEPAIVGLVAIRLTTEAEAGQPFDPHAQAAVDRWLELEPARPEVLNLAAWRLVTRNDRDRRDPRRAEVLSRESLARVVGLPASEQAPSRAAFLDTLAEALFQQGRLAEAATTQRESVALATELELETLPAMTERLSRIEQALGAG